MATAITTAPTTTSAPTTQSQTAGVSLAKNFDTFLKLLTTQLKNQDPTSPMDSKEFTQQLVQFSQVEQSINQNKNLEKLIAMFATQQNSNNLNFIGKIVDVDSDQVKLEEDGVAFWSYDLPKGVIGVDYKIVDSTGKVIRAMNTTADTPGGFKAGRTELAWDGKDSQGNEVVPGTYKLTVTARDSQGKPVDGVKVYARGYVEALETVDGTQYLVVSGNKFEPSKVVSVFAPPEDSAGS